MTETLRGIGFAAALLLLAVTPLHAQSAGNPSGSQEDSGSQDDPASTDGSGSQDDSGELSVVWDDGLTMRNEEGTIEFQIGGSLHQDWTFWDASTPLEDRVGEVDSGNEFRRARLYLQGVLGGAVEFKLQYDFAGGDADFRDAYIGTTGHRVDLRMGQFKEPFSLEELTSANYPTFVERALPNALVPSRNVGFMVHGDAAGGRASWAAGLFRQSDDFGLGTGDDYNVTGRIAGIAWRDEDGVAGGTGMFLHLGANLSYKNVDEASSVRFRARPEAHLAPRFVDTGAFAADSTTLLGAEAALMAGPFSAQGEYVRAAVNSPAVDDPAFGGYYLFGSWFVTGESRPYRGGVFRGVSPRRDFLRDGGPGAWEVAIRLSGLDLDDASIAGGELSDLTLGVNWYWNPNVRMMFNLIRADRSGIGEATAFVWRGQLNL